MSGLGLLGICLAAVFVRWSISLNGYSGANNPPMFGDYEAQRHWMEITYNLHPSEWYVNGTNNDLQYWGLDYPPLTAYHSWLCGLVASQLNTSFVELHSSRGYESADHKLFMRYTVLLADVLIFFPAVIVYFKTCWPRLRQVEKEALSLVSLLSPALLLIDHGHFQYNCVSLGLTLWAVISLSRGRDLLGSVAFVLALNYKQMELYHALPFFCYLLGRCFWGQEHFVWKLLKLAVVVVTTFTLCWLPFLNDVKDVLAVLNRLFPFNRGLFEDKVSNVWCSLSVLIKWKQLVDSSNLVKICGVTTLAASLPSSLHLFVKPTLGKFKMTLINVSLVFFLFSFQVHEKSILIPALSAMCLLPGDPFAAVWFLLVSVFSMLPLLIKDRLVLAMLASMGVFVFGAGLSLGRLQSDQSTQRTVELMVPSNGARILFFLSMAGYAALTFASLALTPPPQLPDLFSLLVSMYSCGHFILFLLYFHWLQFARSDKLFAATLDPIVENRPEVVKVSQKNNKPRKKKQQ